MKTESVRVSSDCSVVVDIIDGKRDGFLLVHGLASNARLWDGVADELGKLGYRVAIVDLRGHGRSDKPETGYDFATISADLAHVLEQLNRTDGFSKPVVVGQSWGASVAESFGAEHPELTRGIVAVDGGMTALAERFPEWSECKLILAPPNMTGIPWEHFESVVRSNHPDWPESGIRGVLANMERLADGTFRPWLSRDHHFEILWHLWQYNPFETCARLKVPILFVPAGGDATRDQEKQNGLERLLGQVQNAKAVWFSPADHDIHAQYPLRLSILLHSEVLTGIFA